MTRLDTHVVVWLYTGDIERLGPAARRAVEHDVPTVSPIVELELTFLHEIGRLRVPGGHVLDDLRQRIGLRTSDTPLGSVVAAAAVLSWTRDPFDRLIVGDAIAASSELVTRDERIRANLPTARW